MQRRLRIAADVGLNAETAESAEKTPSHCIHVTQSHHEGHEGDGATGMVGEGVLLECLNHPDVEQVLVVNRKSM
jgi:hypothetical protein